MRKCPKKSIQLDKSRRLSIVWQGFSLSFLMCHKGVHESILMFRTVQSASLLRRFISLGMIVILLGLAPFAVAQDVHHELAAADHDGHEHSDTDLCQWVQHHTAGSVDLDVPKPAACEQVSHQELPPESVQLSVNLSFVGPSRAPPQS